MVCIFLGGNSPLSFEMRRAQSTHSLGKLRTENGGTRKPCKTSTKPSLKTLFWCQINNSHKGAQESTFSARSTPSYTPFLTSSIPLILSNRFQTFEHSPARIPSTSKHTLIHGKKCTSTALNPFFNTNPLQLSPSLRSNTALLRSSQLGLAVLDA